MTQFTASFDAGTAASQDALLADLVTRMEETEAKANAIQSQYNELFEALLGSTENFYATSGGALEQMDQTLGDGLKILARIIPTGTILFTHQTDRLKLREAGWLICRGEEVSKHDYPELYSVLGNKWGVASNSDRFLLPGPYQLFAQTQEFDALDLAIVSQAHGIIRI